MYIGIYKTIIWVTSFFAPLILKYEKTQV